MIYYVKQDDTIWGCGEEECCGEYSEYTKESFVDMPFGVDITEESLRSEIGGGEILEFREATHLECLSWYTAYDEGYCEGRGN